MKRTGFISIIILQIMSIILIFGISITYNNISMLSISSSETKTLQLNTLSESILNRLIYNPYYIKKYIYPYLKKECKDNFKKDMYKVKLNEDLFKDIKGQYINIKFDDINNRKYLNIKTEILYQNVSSNISCSGPIINDLFELGNPYINYSQLEAEEIESFDFLLDSIKNEMKDYRKDLSSKFASIFLKDDSLTITRSNNNELITNFNDKKLNTKHNFLFIEKDKNKNLELIIGEEDHINDKKINLSGIIFIEGNFVVNQDLDFKGILIVQDGEFIINKDVDLNVEGIIIHKGYINKFPQLNLSYNKDYIYYYGIELPGFMNLYPELIKKY